MNNINTIRELVFIIFMAVMIVKYILDCFDNEWDFYDRVTHFCTRTIIVCIVYFVFM